ncbi:MAG: hypothetical protein HGGPFJEG_02092 [Ignavibacteria bacterium]|nr:hypothetical protein [Ignavibacteria bacterium]
MTIVSEHIEVVIQDYGNFKMMIDIKLLKTDTEEMMIDIKQMKTDTEEMMIDIK